MKNGTLLIFIVLISCKSTEVNGPPIEADKFSFTVSSIDTVLSVNEAPALDVRIMNHTDASLLLVQAVDGSHYQMRYPHVYYTINGKKPTWARCGNTSCLKEKNIIDIRPNSSFNPFQDFQNAMPFMSVSRLHKELFDSVGIYNIQFHYSTQAPDIYSYNGPLCPAETISGVLKKAIKTVPSISLSSNVLSIQIVDSSKIVL